MNEMRPMRKYLFILPAFLLFVYAFFLSLRPLSDPDLWWQLRQGQWIIENKALPGEIDPFSYTNPRFTAEELAGLRSQWLGQVIFYLAYLSGGYPALSAFRALLIILPFLYLFFRALKKGADPLSLSAVLSFPLLIIGISLFNTYERAQAFSFLLLLPVFLLLKGLRDGRRQAFWALPVLMAAWANLHGGYVVGAAVIGAFMAGELIGRLLRAAGLRAVHAGGGWRFFAACLLGIAATGLNPGGYYVLDRLRGFKGELAGGAQTGTILYAVLEYKPLWYFYTTLHLKWPIYITAFMVVAVIAVLLRYGARRKIDAAELSALFAVGFLALYYARGVGFALIVFSLVLCDSLSVLRGLRRAVPALASAAVSFSMLLWVYGMAPGEMRPGPPRDWVNQTYPEGAIGFLKEHEVRGPMFNHLRWGGYMIWRTPEYKVFADGRSASGKATSVYLTVIGAAPGWKDALDSYGVNFVFVPVMRMEGGVITPLVLGLAEEGRDEWRPVYLKDNSVVFLRNIPSNAPVLDCCALSVSAVYFEILALSDRLLASMPGHPDAMFSKAVALNGLGRPDEAEGLLMTLPPSELRQRYVGMIRKKRG